MRLFPSSLEMRSDVYRTEMYQQQLVQSQSEQLAHLSPMQRMRARAAGAVAMRFTQLIGIVAELQSRADYEDRAAPRPRWNAEFRAWVFR